MIESKRSGVSADNVYEPRLWYYDLLLFTADNEIQRVSKSTLDDDDNTQQTDEEEDEMNQAESTSQSQVIIAYHSFTCIYKYLIVQNNKKKMRYTNILMLKAGKVQDFILKLYNVN